MKDQFHPSPFGSKRMYTRRQILISQLGLTAGLSVSRVHCEHAFAYCSPGLELQIADFKNGDLLFPKVRGQWILRTGPLQQQFPEPETEFQRSRSQFLRELEELREPTEHQIAVQRFISSLATYRDLERGFDLGEWPLNTLPRSSVGSPLGHVALLEKLGASWTVIDAAWNGRVQRSTYHRWRNSERGCQPVWHARIVGESDQIINAMVEIAAGELHKPYRLFSLEAFDFSDTRSFYCSKLIWFAYWKATNGKDLLASDRTDNAPDGRISRLVSPLEILNSPRVQVLTSQGDYKRG